MKVRKMGQKYEGNLFSPGGWTLSYPSLHHTSVTTKRRKLIVIVLLAVIGGVIACSLSCDCEDAAASICGCHPGLATLPPPERGALGA